MKTLLVATDFSVTAKNATRYAVDMAQAMQAEVCLLHVYQLPVNYGTIDIPVGMPDWEKETEDLLTEIKKREELRTGGHVHIHTEVRLGSFLIELNAVCDQIKPYAVIMGSKGSTAAEHLLFGSHSVNAVKHLSWPVLTVPLDATFHAIRTMGLACDLEEPETSVPIGEIIGLATDFDATIFVLNTRSDKTYDPQIVFASGWLGKKLKNVKHKFHFIEGNTDNAILDFAKNNAIDILVILPRHHSFWDALIHKSHSRQFVLHSDVPLLALHQHANAPVV